MKSSTAAAGVAEEESGGCASIGGRVWVWVRRRVVEKNWGMMTVFLRW